MTDEELAKCLRDLGMHSAVVVADRIEQLTAQLAEDADARALVDDRLKQLVAQVDALTAERDRYRVSNMQMLGDIAVSMGRVEALTAERDAAVHLARMRKSFIEEARDERDAAEAERDRLREALEQIAQWSEAYPTEVFPEPDFAQAAAALSLSGMSIDAVSASNMRHATKGVGKIARAALKGETP